MYAFRLTRTVYVLIFPDDFLQSLNSYGCHRHFWILPTKRTQIRHVLTALGILNTCSTPRVREWADFPSLIALVIDTV